MPDLSKAVPTLLVINIIFFILTYVFNLPGIEYLALYFPLNEKFNYWQIITHMFMHGSLLHIGFNMFALWSFGTPLEAIWKKPKFLIFYFCTGFGSAVFYTLVNYYQFIQISNDILSLGYSQEYLQVMLERSHIEPRLMFLLGKDRFIELLSIYNTPVVGASGAIYGVLVAFAFSYPRAKLSLIFLPVPISAKYFVPLIISGDLFFGVTQYSIGNVAHFAHIGGALTGLLIILYWLRKVHKKMA